MEYYQCYTCYKPNTRGKRHADVVGFLPQYLIMPGLSSTEQDTKATKELIQVLKNPGPQAPFIIEASQLHSIDILEKIFNTMKPEKT